MARKVFYSFHYSNDNWRVQQIKNAGVVEGQPILSSNGWEEVKRQGQDAIKRWINEQMADKSCVVVLIGSHTASRKWVKYEIEKAWNAKRGLVGVYIHGLKDVNGNQSSKGSNPFNDFTVQDKSLASIVEAHDTPYTSSEFVYDHIKSNLARWVEDAIDIRRQYG